MTDIRNNPHFILFPTNINRTGYQPFALPVLYVEPRRIDENGNGIDGSQAISIRYYVVDAPDPARVNGPFNQNVRIPDESLFDIILNQSDLAQRQLDVSGLQFYGSDGSPKNFSDVIEGDEFEYNMSGPIVGSTPTSRVIYYPDAYYYDLSDISIDVDQLIKPKHYLFVWESVYFRRLSTASGDLKCITGEQGLSQLMLDVNHPGDVHEQMFRMTPMLYFDFERNTVKDDPTLKFYRPFADLLQDIFDEQGFLDGVNQIDTIPAEYIPYLAFLIGVDLPNFPGTTDSLRRSILRRGTELQKLKSSRRVLVELFDMFGFIVDIVNLYASLDGNSYLSPNNGLNSKLVTQTDLVVNDYDATGFGLGLVPLIYRPRRNSQVSLHAWIVEDGSTKYNELLDISNGLSNNLESENIDGSSFNVNGVLEPSFVNDIGISGGGIIGYSTVIVGKTDGSSGRPVLNSNNIFYNESTNALNLNFDHELGVDVNGKVFIFASYERNKITIPNSLSNTRTNKFDVEFISKQGLTIDFNLLQFLLDFVFNLKGFHSILRKIKVPIENFDVYGVTDTCVDGKDPFAAGTALGDLQSSPAVIPIDLSCQEDDDRGFSSADTILRKAILDGLEEEFQAWKALSPDDCGITPNGQDKVVDDGIIDSVTDNDLPDYDHEVDDRQTLCGSNPQKLDYCYKGRVGDNLKQILVLPSVDRYSCNPCGPGLGDVVYWEESNRVDIDGQNRGLLRRRILNRQNGSTLHYTDTPFFDKLSKNTLAITPVNVNIEKDNLGYPSHRFLGMGNLENDYNFTDETISIGCFDRSEVLKRPWDEVDECGFPNLLNARLVDIGGNQELIWDEEELVYYGNGIESDIPSLSDHNTSVSDGRIITHKVYQNSSASHPSLAFDSTTFTDDETIDTSSVITGPIFDSNCLTTNEDYVGGYPSSYGLVSAVKTTFVDGDTDDQFVFSDDETVGISTLNRVEIANNLCIGYSTDITGIEARFFGNSMEYIDSNNTHYRYYVPLRMDCGCLNSSCGTDDPTGVDGISCNDQYLYDNEGNIDPDCDKLELDLSISLSDTITLCDRISDHDLNDLFCLNEECDTPTSGSFVYKDDYDIIYKVEWLLMEDMMDITVITKDPRIPNEDEDGFVINENGSIKIFRKGVITTVRQIIKIDNGGSYIDAEGSDIVVDYFQSNISCGEKQFDKPFAYGVDCALQSNVEVLVTDGPRWISYDGADSSFEYDWVNPLDESDIVFWIDPLNVIEEIDVDSISTDGQSSSSSSSSSS